VAVDCSDVEEDVVVLLVVASPSQVSIVEQPVSVMVLTVEVDTPLLSVKYSIKTRTSSRQDAAVLVVHSPSPDSIGIAVGAVVGAGVGFGVGWGVMPTDGDGVGSTPGGGPGGGLGLSSEGSGYVGSSCEGFGSGSSS
jgi:hypothetical protein